MPSQLVKKKNNNRHGVDGHRTSTGSVPGSVRTENIGACIITYPPSQWCEHALPCQFDLNPDPDSATVHSDLASSPLEQSGPAARNGGTMFDIPALP